jgi:hypothetical protein
MMTLEGRGTGGASHRRGMKPLVAFAGLLALLVVGFGIAVVLHRQVRPNFGLQPAEVAGTQLPVGASPATNEPTSAAGQTSALQFARTPLETEVERALSEYWRIYSDAVLNGNTSRLHEVLEGDALRWVTDEVNDLRAKGQAAKIVLAEQVASIEHVSETRATVAHRYVNHSVYVDTLTKQPRVASDGPIRVLQTYDFRKTDGRWKIYSGTWREE